MLLSSPLIPLLLLPSRFFQLFLFPSVLPGGDSLGGDVNGGQFVPLIGVISVRVVGKVKRNERVKKEDTTVHYTPAAA